MTDQFAFLGDKCKAAIVAISLGVLLLLPASLGYGGTIIQEAFGQFNLPLLEDEEVTEEEEDGEIVVEEEEEEETTTTTTTTPTTPTTPAAPTDTTTTVQDPSTYLMADRNVDPVRGFIGSTLPTQGAGGNALTATGDSGHVATGRFRVFANESTVRSFVAEMNIAAVDGSTFHNITIREGDPHRFDVTAGNETTAASSSIVGNIFIDGGATPVIDNVPMTLTIRGQTLAIQGIDIDETRITDTGQRDIVSVIDGQTIYGTIPRT
jgi:cytoskeletal protein RodZ